MRLINKLKEGELGGKHMKKLKLFEGQRFEAYIEEKINEDSLFFHEYEMAVNSLNNIWEIQADDIENIRYTAEKPNNIIAFCGERGSGKSSIMLSFVRAVENSYKNEDELRFSDKIRENNWKSRIIVDPSMFDGVHNILDVVLAHIYYEFNAAYENNNQMIEPYEREKILHQLSKVYKNLSIIKNKDKMLDDEYDESGNISKLRKLGESTLLRKELSVLVDMYLKFISGRGDEKKCKKLLLAIDDLDLCNENVYEMSEQIRKYLVVPNIIIVMAVRIEQLEMGIEEKYRRAFKNTLAEQGSHDYLEQEMRNMAEHYATKLIPKARRIYLPVLRSDQIELEKDWGQGNSTETNSKNIECEIIELIREKTGINFIPAEGGDSYLIPEILRDLVNFISLLKQMESPGEDLKIKVNNIIELKVYFIEEMMKKELKRSIWGRMLEVMESADRIRNYNMASFLAEPFIKAQQAISGYLNSNWVFPRGSLASVIEVLSERANCFTKKEDMVLTNYVRIYYTILLNEKLIERADIMDLLIGDFIWGNCLNTIIPGIESENHQILMYRGRFFINILECWNTIADAFEENNLLFVERKDASKDKVRKIRKEELNELSVWMLLSLFSSNYVIESDGKVYMNKNPIVHNNYNISPNIFVSIEDYVVNLCKLEKIYEFSNLELLGIEKELAKNVFAVMEKENEELIKQAKALMTNVDLSMQLLDYCRQNSDYKQATESQEDRTYQLIKRFFENLSDFMVKAGMKRVDWTTFWLPTKIAGDGEVQGNRVNICKIYTKVCMRQADILKHINPALNKEQTSQKLKQQFAQKVTMVAVEDYTGTIREITKSIRQKNKNVAYLKEWLENVANRVQKYTFREKRMPDGLHSELLMDLYSEVVDLYIENPEITLTEQQYSKYKTIAQIKNTIE